MLPKLHKRKRINELIKKEQSENINVEKNIIVKARPIFADVFHK